MNKQVEDYEKKNELIHFGIKGQKWGIRRYQNEDGSLTPEGIEHYSKKYKLYSDSPYYARYAEKKLHKGVAVNGITGGVLGTIGMGLSNIPYAALGASMPLALIAGTGIAIGAINAGFKYIKEKKNLEDIYGTYCALHATKGREWVEQKF